MPWIEVSQLLDGEASWIRTTSILGVVPLASGGQGSQLLLLSGATLEVTEEREALLQKIKELEGTAARDRRVGFPSD